MKAFQYIVISLFFIHFSLPAKAQIDDIKGVLDDTFDEIGDSDLDIAFDLVYFFFEIGFYPTAGLLFGFPDERIRADMARYPYEYSHHGLYLPPEEIGYDVRANVVGHYQNNEDALSGGFMQVKFTPHSGFTLDLSHLQLFQAATRQEDGDDLSFTAFSVNYNRIRHEKFHLWWGLGAMRIGSTEEGYLDSMSPTITSGFTWYIKKPISLYGDVQFAWPDAVPSQLYQLRLQGHINRMMIYGGMQGISVGDANVLSWTIGTGIFF